MIPILSGNVASALPTGYDVTNSCRFNDGDGAYLKRTSASPTSDKIGTYSTWFKIGVMGTDRRLTMSFVDGNNYGYLRIHSDDTLQFYVVGGGSVVASMITNQVFRDPSAWYNVILAVDTTQVTEANRIKIYVNGTQVTSFSTATYFSQNTVNAMFSQSGTNYHTVGAAENGTVSWDGYMAETFFIDGTQLAASAFGEFDDDSPTIWKPKDCSGDFTYGNNGFYLDFEDSDNLGDDESGNTDDFTEVNLAAVDQASDSPTNNFATANSIMGSLTATFAEGNLSVATTSGQKFGAAATLGVSQGKWYAEYKVTAQSADVGHVGVDGDPQESARADNYAGGNAWSYGYNGGNGNKFNSDSATSYGDTFSTNDIVGVALDLTNHKLYFHKNGTWQDSGDPTSGSTGTGSAYNLSTSPPSGFYFFTSQDGSPSNNATLAHNYGNPIHSISSGNSDANGYGNFEYAPPSGYYALCTKNLAEYG
jgi:hypothetical protein